MFVLYCEMEAEGGWNSLRLIIDFASLNDRRNLLREAHHEGVAFTFGNRLVDGLQVSQLEQARVRFHQLGRIKEMAESRRLSQRIVCSVWRISFIFATFIPFIGRICLGDPNCYRHLAVYTEDFAREISLTII